MRFVVEETQPDLAEETAAGNRLTGTAEGALRRYRSQPLSRPGRPVDPESSDPESWRREVAARLSHYRARRRPREPRYPSLQLKFESEPVRNILAGPAEPLSDACLLYKVRRSYMTTRERALDFCSPHKAGRAGGLPRLIFAASTEATAKVIEFASYSPASRPADELAEPVFDRPRIIEAPELVPPPPALGGILDRAGGGAGKRKKAGIRNSAASRAHEPAHRCRRNRRRARDFGNRRVCLHFFQDHGRGSTARQSRRNRCPFGCSLWSAYQYLLLVYSSATPGLKLARLELQMFDGSPVPRRIRRWRVLASVLSGVSLGLGYAWCLLDEDELCWHDRITRTYMAPKR